MNLPGGASLGHRLYEGVAMALESVRVNRLRAGLTILGVAIGAMVVIAMAATLTGIHRTVTSIIERTGPKTLFVVRFFREGLDVDRDEIDRSTFWQRFPELTVDEARRLRELPSIEDVTAREVASGSVSYGNERVPQIAIAGLNPAWIKVLGGEMRAGRNWTAVEEASGARVAVVNPRLAQLLFNGLDPVGRRVRVEGLPFTVIGVYTDPSSMLGTAGPPALWMPHPVFTKVVDYFKGWLTIIVIPKPTATVAEAQEEIISSLRASRRLKPAEPNTFSILTGNKLLQTFDQVTAGFFLIMLALSSVGLLVGGVGVVAIMMISVTERTREIGVRKAVGATRREVLFQFLVEAATLTMLGGAVGLLWGGGIAWTIRRFTPIPAEVPLWSVVVALAASVVTGIFFGLYPASRAARLDPVEALRHE
ncbi:MAG: ABC transporter permease [Gemmatimonadales bacterium]